MKTLFAAIACTGSLLAQQVLVVDIGGGTPFQQIQPAINAANAGDIIEVNPGVYAPFTCAKPVRILGTAGVIVAETFAMSAITISNIPAGATCMISQFELRSPMTPCICEPLIAVSQCAGLVILDEIQPDFPSLEPRIDVTGVAGLVLRDSYVGPLTISASEVHLDGVTVDTASRTSGALIDLDNSELLMTDGLIRTHQCCGFNFAIDLSNSRASLRVVQGLQVNLNPGNHDFFLDSASRVDYDPATTFAPLGVPTTWPSSTGPVVATVQPALNVTPAGPGGTVQVAMRHTATPSFLCAFLGAPISPITVPGIEGSLFFGGVFIAQIGCFATGSTVVNTSFPIPNSASFSGLVFAVQGVALGGTFPTTNADVLRIQ